MATTSTPTAFDTLDHNATPAPDLSNLSRPPAPTASSAWLRPHVVNAVFRRNVASYFVNPAGYVFITLFVLVCSYVAFCRPEFFSNNLATLDTLNEWMPYLLLFFVPAITMSLWAEERKQGTEELLLTLPAKDLEVVIGKYLAALGIYTAALVFTAPLAILLMVLGRPDPGVLISTFLGYWLMGAMLISVGMVASLLSTNVTVAFILGALFCAVPVFLDQAGWLFGSLTARQVVEDLAVPTQFRDFGAGVVSFGGIFYFLSTAVVMLFLNMVLLGRRHWAGGEASAGKWVHAVTRAVALAVAMGSATVIVAALGWRLDASEEQLHTLSPETIQIVKSLPEDRPVYVRAFFSPEVPRDYVTVKRDLINVLRRVNSTAGKRVQLDLIETQLYSEEAASAAKLGITPRQVVTADEARRSTNEIVLGVAFTCGTEEVVLPFLEPGVPVEYEVARSLKVVAGGQRKKLGVLTTDAALMGGGGFMTGQTSEWAIISELRKQYNVRSISPDGPIDPKEVDVLIAAMPSSLTQPQMDNLRAFIKAGGPTLILDDPLPLSNPMLSPPLSKPAPGRQSMFGGPPPTQPKGDIRQLLDDLGVSWPTTDIVWNPDNPHPQLADGLPEEIVFVTRNTGLRRGARDNAPGLSNTDPIVAGMQEIVLLFAGRINRVGKPGLTFTPLIRTDVNGGLIDWRRTVRSQLDFGDMDVVEAVQMASQLGIPGAITLNPRRPRVPTGTSYTLAARIQSEASAKSSNQAQTQTSDASTQESSKIHVVFVADLDLISDQFFALRGESVEQLRRRGMGNLILDNVNFILNCVDVLAGDMTFVELRKRRPLHRTLEGLERQTQQFVEKTQEQLKTFEEEEKRLIDKAQTEFNKEVEAVERDETLEPVVKEAKLRYLKEVAERKLDQRRREIEDQTRLKIEEAKTEKERQIRGIQNQTRTYALALPPLLPAVLGLVVFFSRASRENRGANPNRLV